MIKSLKPNFLLTAIILLVIFGGFIAIKYKSIVKPYCTLQDTKFVPGKHTYAQLKKYEDCQPVSFYLKENTTNEQVNTLKQQLVAMNGVYKVVYTSPEQADANYREINKNKPLVLAGLPKGINSFIGNFDVYISDPNLKDGIVQQVKSGENGNIIHTVINPHIAQ